MENRLSVSVIMATYNCELKKIYYTIDALCKQQGVSYEVLVSDDGSKFFDKKEIERFFKEFCFENYQIIENEVNQGTIKNILSASKRARGDYLFFTSPGDILFDEYVLADFYKCATEHRAKIVFGNYIEYSNENGNIMIHKRPNRPLVPKVFEKDFQIYKTSFCFGMFITGAVIFREKKIAIQSLEYVYANAKYVEDNTTICYALANKIQVYFYDRKMVWYEVGAGISNSGNSKWNQIIYNELKDTFERLIKDYPTDKILRTGYASYFRKYGKWTKFILIVAHPKMCYTVMRNKKMPKQITKCTEEEKHALQNALSRNI